MTGTLLDDAGNPLAGTISLTPSLDQLVSASTGVVIYLTTKFYQLDATGSFSVPLICSNEASVSPNGVTWTLSTVGPVDIALSMTFIVPNDQLSANISDYVTSINVPPLNAILFGSRGPQGTMGIADDSSVAALVNAAGSVTRAALDAHYVPVTQLVVSPTSPSTPTLGLVWIQNG